MNGFLEAGTASTKAEDGRWKCGLFGPPASEDSVLRCPLEHLTHLPASVSASPTAPECGSPETTDDRTPAAFPLRREAARGHYMVTFP